MSCLEPYKNWVTSTLEDTIIQDYTESFHVSNGESQSMGVPQDHCFQWLRAPNEVVPSDARHSTVQCEYVRQTMRTPRCIAGDLITWPWETFPEEILSGFVFRCFTFSHAIRVYPEGSSLVALLHIARVPLHWFHLHHLVFLQLGDWNIRPVCLSIGYPIHWSNIMLSLRYIMFLIP